MRNDAVQYKIAEVVGRALLCGMVLPVESTVRVQMI